MEALDALEASDFELVLTFIPAGCGDGALAETEECDDGNNVADDGCAPSCKIEVPELPGD